MPMYLGVRCVIAKSFARIHVANLINAGILPLTFATPEDYDTLTLDSKLCIDNIFAGMESGSITAADTATGRKISLCCNLTQRQQRILKAGGLLPFIGEGNV